MRATKSLILGFVVASAISIIGAQQPAVLTPASAVNGAGVLPSGATVGGTLFTSTTSTSTTGLVEETLLSYTLPANTLSANNRGVRITAGFTEAANANAKTRSIYFGSTIVATRADTTTGQKFMITATVFRTGASAQYALGWDPVGLLGTSTTPAETLSGAVLIKVTGTTPTTIGDLTNTFLLVEAI